VGPATSARPGGFGALAEQQVGERGPVAEVGHDEQHPVVRPAQQLGRAVEQGQSDRLAHVPAVVRQKLLDNDRLTGPTVDPAPQHPRSA
jgi:hypothetical protein